MQKRFPRVCLLCNKPGVSNLSSNLESIHDITGIRRSKLLKKQRFPGNLKVSQILQALYLVNRLCKGK